MSVYDKAARQVAEADALIITAGAGMGVDSGLPDFRGDAGFWKAYPALYGYSFTDMANPHWFYQDPNRAWGFYGHRLNLYRSVVPHAGFEILRRWALAKNDNYYIFTSNVDGQFQKAGFSPEQIVECHGSIHFLQDLSGSDGVWSAEDIHVDVEESTLQAVGPLPCHNKTGAVLRPNILMFGDGNWNSSRTMRQESRYEAWLQAQQGKKIVVIEIGAGTSIPTVRFHGQRLARSLGATLIRINPRESMIDQHRIADRGISIAVGAVAGLSGIQAVYEGF